MTYPLMTYIGISHLISKTIDCWTAVACRKKVFCRVS